MVNKTVAIYVFFDDMLKSMNHKEPESRKTTDAEIIPVVLLAARYFAGNIEKSLCFVHSTGLMPGKSRFNRKLHQIGELLSELFFHTRQAGKELTLQSVYSIDSFSVPVCRNIRIANSRTVEGEEYRGKCASERVYFYGYKFHMIVTSDGIPVECTFTTGSTHDIDGIKQLPGHLPERSELSADSAYTPKKIHAVTENGFLIKLIMFIWAYTFDKLYKL